jgi:mRNA-degrading endonuclease RelE of RelBE toxin-antitoxin system
LKICFTDDFWDEFRRLPAQVQKQAKRAFEHLALDQRYPSLQYKCVNHAEGKYSIRINLVYRALGYMQGDEVTWYWIGHHSKYERLI